MEKIFKSLSQVSASFVFLVLVATVTVLYLYAKPAIEQFGAYFIVDPRWGVEVKVEDHEKTIQPKLSAQEHADAQHAKHLDSVLEDEVANDAMNSDDDHMDAGLDDLDSMDDDVIVDSESGDSDSGMSESSDGTVTKVIYGGAVPIVGTLFSTAIAMLFAVPIAMGIAVFLSEIAHEKLVAPVGVAIELLAAIPSIIYGMWALFYFGPFIASIFGGHSVSLLVAGLVLGIMVIPFMAALSRDAINTTPDVLKESAYAMGATKFEVTKDIIFPYAKAGIIGSIIISLGRAMGETMAVAFVIGGVFEFAEHVTDPTNSIPVVLANNFAESSGISMNALFYLALILFVVSFAVIFLAKHYFLRRNKL
jgi:phosphate transport system permease protein